MVGIIVFITFLFLGIFVWTIITVAVMALGIILIYEEVEKEEREMKEARSKKEEAWVG
jgi:hypothetical protein